MFKKTPKNTFEINYSKCKDTADFESRLSKEELRHAMNAKIVLKIGKMSNLITRLNDKPFFQVFYPYVIVYETIFL